MSQSESYNKRMREREELCEIPISAKLNKFEVVLLMINEIDWQERKDFIHLQILEENPK